MSLTTPLDTTAAAVTATSAASFAAGSLAPEAIGVLFGAGLASGTVAASTTPLPTTLGNAQAQVRDSAGTTRSAPLFFVSPTQINFQIPASTATGAATVNVLLNGATVGTGSLAIASVTPGLFAANANGQGVAAAVLLRIKADGAQSYEAVAQLNATTNRYEAAPIDFGAATDQLFLVAYGTGFRYRSSLSAVTCTMGGTSATVGYAGEQGAFVGLDQLNISLPRSLAGRGNADVAVSVDGKSANTVTLNFK